MTGEDNRALRAPVVATLTPQGREILGGELAEISLSSLLQLAQYEALSGWLAIPSHGYIALHGGHVVGSRCGRLAGLEALRELLFHRGGRFVVLRGEPLQEHPLDNITFAVMDAYRLRDEWGRLREMILRPVGGPRWRPTGGLLDVLASRLDGRRTLADAIAGIEPVTLALDAVLDALDIGLLEEVTRPPGAATLQLVPEAENESYFELLDRGRDLMRRGSYDAAESALRRALALRPDDRVVLQNLRALEHRRSRL